MAGPNRSLFATAALAALLALPAVVHAGDGVSIADSPGGTAGRTRTWTTPPRGSDRRAITTPPTGRYAAPAPTTTYVDPGTTTYVDPGTTTYVDPGTTYVDPGATTYVDPGTTTYVDPGATVMPMLPSVPAPTSPSGTYFAPSDSQTFAAPPPPEMVTSTPQAPSMRRNNRRSMRRGRNARNGRVRGQRAQMPAQAAAVQFRFSVGDEILISIWDKDVESGTIDLRQRILRDGTISPLWLDPIRVQDRTIAEVRSELVQAYGEYYKIPRITVGVISIHQERAFVLGEVATPTAVSLNGPQSLLQVLAQAGGILPSSGSQTVRVVRAQGKGRCPRVMRVNTKTLCRRPFMVLPGDVVYVHPTGVATWSRDMVTALAPLQSLFGATGGAAATYLAFDQIGSNDNGN